MRTRSGTGRIPLAVVLLGCVIASNAVAHGARTPRKVSCANAHLPINQTMYSWYHMSFSSFEQPQTRQGKDTLNFEAIASLSNIASGGADLMEFFVTLGRIEQAVAPANVTISEIEDIWFSEWTALGQKVENDAVMYENQGDTEAAASAYNRAWNYYMTGERLSDHLSSRSLQTYQHSISMFQSWLNVSQSKCAKQRIPYYQNSTLYHLHGYWCPAQSVDKPRATILLMTGYDGTAEMLLQSVGFDGMRRGFNVLAFEGPGQGSVSRFQRLSFRPDWEVVVSQVKQWLLNKHSDSVDAKPLVLWGRSFGGYLAPRAFAEDETYTALVVDGGLYDFYQVLLCSLPSSLQQLWYKDPPKFSKTVEEYGNYSLSLKSVLQFGYLGFGVKTAEGLYRSAESYTLESAINGIQDRPVLVSDPALDTIVQNQSAIFFSQLPRPLAAPTVLQQLDPLRGGGLHSSVGSTAYTGNAHFAWLRDVMQT